jgi:hypothetical protein
MDAPKINDKINETKHRPVALMREIRRSRLGASDEPPPRRPRATLSAAQVMRAVMLLAVGFACAAGVHAGSARAQALQAQAGEQSGPALPQMVNINR